ncbi:MAG TPA: MarR family transcriptional regulator [Thermoleophilaceae bacterium]|nr:MarR family transcriptional regulator [Thermoleophilaceae bacterium]
MRTKSADQAAELPARLRLAIARTARRMRQEAGDELSPSMTAALATIENHGPLTPSGLADIERIKRPTATRILHRLEEDGLIERSADPSDGRSAVVCITSQGAALLKKLRSRKNAYLARRLRELPAEDVAALERAAGVLERLLDGERR